MVFAQFITNFDQWQLSYECKQRKTNELVPLTSMGWKSNKRTSLKWGVQHKIYIQDLQTIYYMFA